MRDLYHKSACHTPRRARQRGVVVPFALVLSTLVVWAGCGPPSARAPEPLSSKARPEKPGQLSGENKRNPPPKSPLIMHSHGGFNSLPAKHGATSSPHAPHPLISGGATAPPPLPATPTLKSGAAGIGHGQPSAATSIDFTAIDRALASLPKGNIAFNAPQTMILGQSYPIYLLLSPQESMQNLQRELQQQLAGGQNLGGATIKIAPEMEARLTGENFSITAEGSEKQLVVGEGETQWRWEVAPQRAGIGELHLTLSVLLDVNGGAVPRSIQTFDRDIAVNVTWGQRLGSFFGGHWEWIFVVIIIPAGKWLWDKRRKQKAGRGSAAA